MLRPDSVLRSPQYDLYTAVANPFSKTDSAGHIGGMAFGLLAAYRFKRGMRMFRR